MPSLDDCKNCEFEVSAASVLYWLGISLLSWVGKSSACHQNSHEVTRTRDGLLSASACVLCMDRLRKNGLTGLSRQDNMTLGHWWVGDSFWYITRSHSTK